MSTELALSPASIDPGQFFKPEQVDLIKRQIAKNVTDDELKLFLYQCARTGLDPFSRQIYAISRNEWDPDARVKRLKMSIQTGIDGLRLIADRTGRYAPGPENDYTYDDDRKLVKATAHVLKRTGDGTWHKISVSAFFGEYAQFDKDGYPTRMWKEKPHIMLGKCAEALALRKAFPAEMSGIYTSEEMGNADAAPPQQEYIPPKAESPKESAPPPSPLHVVPAESGASGHVEPTNREPGSDDEEEEVAGEALERVWCYDPETGEQTREEPKADRKQVARIHILRVECGLTEDEYHKRIKDLFCKESTSQLSVREASIAIDKLEERKKRWGGAKEREAREAAKNERKARRAADMPPEMLEMLTEEPPR